MKSLKLLDELEQKLAELEALKESARELTNFSELHMVKFAFDNPNDNEVRFAICEPFRQAFQNLKDLVN